MAATVKIMNQKQFQAGLAALRQEMGTTNRGVMRRQMAILSGQLVKRYPPKNRKEGKQAIENDLKKIMIPIPADKYETLERWQDDLENIHDVFDDSGSRIADWHRQHRNPRTLRTRAIKSKRWVAGRDFSDKLHVRERDFKKYVNLQAQNVGKLKAGWKQTKWRGAAKPPAFVTKQSNRATTIDRMNKDGSGYLQIINTIKGSARWKRIDSFVIRSRDRGFQKELKHAARKVAQKYNRRAA